ncbi:hypothetical protein DM01DRAFT_1332549 [Hesseltinella vesiculosa]|uniref:R3H-associated N-terminal domain-containing protein n=1 Tax=Hesseltinella vesiculosa TaxID=101127 RepID=A0A1X2GSC0_9FUNG|nr:hypothetical protein DM01DRAFT_1332549 [Hesseltinella vesiculosa]
MEFYLAGESHEQPTEGAESLTPSKPLAKKKKKKPKNWLPRDSLAKRYRLLVGKEGSRRRQRWDNNHLSQHPLAILYKEDLMMPGYVESGPFWSQPEIMALVEDEELFDMAQAFHQQVVQVNSSHLPHSAMRSLRKKHVPQGMIAEYEQELMEFLAPSTSLTEEVSEASLGCVFDPYEGDEELGQEDEDEDLYIDVAPEFLIWQTNNPFVRYVLHVMCHYYCLQSFTNHDEDGSSVVVVHPDHDPELTNDYEQPQMTFFEALF